MFGDCRGCVSPSQKIPPASLLSASLRRAAARISSPLAIISRCTGISIFGTQSTTPPYTSPHLTLSDGHSGRRLRKRGRMVVLWVSDPPLMWLPTHSHSSSNFSLSPHRESMIFYSHHVKRGLRSAYFELSSPHAITWCSKISPSSSTCDHHRNLIITKEDIPPAICPGFSFLTRMDLESDAMVHMF